MRVDPVTKKLAMHKGIDIGAEKSANVLAVYDGTITAVYYEPTYGNVVEYKTDNGFKILYAHLDKPLVIVNQKVKQGDIICLVGSTGWSTGDHLHYEVSKDNKLINPITLVTLNHTEGFLNEYVQRGETFNGEN